MLSAILGTLRAAGRPLCLADLATELAVDEPALEGMVETLVARGRLRALTPGADECTACPISGGCFIMRDGVATMYLPVD